MTPHKQHIDLEQITAAAGLLAAIVNGTDDAIIAKNLDGEIIFWNPAAERMFGYTEREALGSPISMLIPDGHRGEDVVVMDRILAGASVQHYETQRQAKDGTLVDVSLSVSALKDPDGTVIGASKIMRDISASRAARVDQERLAAVIESSDDAIIAKDSSGIITDWNPAAERMFGYSASEAVGMPISKLIPPDLAGQERDTLGEILAGRKVDHYETVRMHRDGTPVDVSLTVSPLRDANGTIIGAAKVVRDVSERKRIEAHAREAAELARANEQLAAADRLKDQFLAMANHELRTPLTSIAGFTQTLKDLGPELTEQQRAEFLDIIASQTDRLARLVDDMLTLSRVELGVIEVRPAEIDVIEEIRSTLHGARRDDVVIIDPDEEHLTAFVDPAHFQQMVLNYVDNARKYGSDPIEVCARRDGNDVVLCVCDSGDGVPPDFEPFLFDRFARSPDTVQSNLPGTGLGLSIVRGLARAQGGEAWHEPNEPSGARFFLRLPHVGATER